MFLATAAGRRRRRRAADDRSQPAAGHQAGHRRDGHPVEGHPPGLLALPRRPHRRLLDLRPRRGPDRARGNPTAAARGRRPEPPGADATFKERRVLEFGGDRLELAYHGPNHTPDNIFIYAPRQRRSWWSTCSSRAGCRSRTSRYRRTSPAGCAHTTSPWTTRWTTLVGGHLGRLGVRADGDLQRQYIARPRRKRQADAGEPRPDAVLPASTARRATPGRSSRPTSTPPPSGRRPGHRQVPRPAAGADVFTVDNALALFESCASTPEPSARSASDPDAPWSPKVPTAARMTSI